MAFFVRPSKYRHVYGTCAKRDFCYDNIRVSANAWDTNMVKANPVSVYCAGGEEGEGKKGKY